MNMPLLIILLVTMLVTMEELTLSNEEFKKQWILLEDLNLSLRSAALRSFAPTHIPLALSMRPRHVDYLLDGS